MYFHVLHYFDCNIYENLSQLSNNLSSTLEGLSVHFEMLLHNKVGRELRVEKIENNFSLLGATNFAALKIMSIITHL